MVQQQAVQVAELYFDHATVALFRESEIKIPRNLGEGLINLIGGELITNAQWDSIIYNYSGTTSPVG